METANILTSKGTTTIPKHVRDELGLKSGDKVRFVKNSKGSYGIEKELTLEDIQRMNAKLTKGIPRMTKEELHEGMAQQAIDRYNRSFE